MDAAQLLRRARARAGLSLRSLARRAGTSHSTLAAYEAARVVPTVDTLDRLVGSAGFELTVVLARRVRGDEHLDRGDELVQVLELGEQFPARHEPTITCPPFAPATSAVSSR